MQEAKLNDEEGEVISVGVMENDFFVNTFNPAPLLHLLKIKLNGCEKDLQLHILSNLMGLVEDESLLESEAKDIP